ncbi:MAG: methionyl-tRNA formyltransferase [Hyphomicrobiaceae bacterium]
MRVVFMGTPAFSVPMLAALIGAGHDVAAVYAQPPRPAGRGMTETKAPVHEFAEEAAIPVLTPHTLRTAEALAAFRAHEADVAVVVAYGLILPKAILEAPRLGCLNMHASKLPRWRGAAPIQRAIMAGDTETAAMVMQMEEGLDTGPVLLAERVPIGPDTTAGELHDTLAEVGADLMVRALAALERGSLTATPQPADGTTYAAKIEKAEAHIDFARTAAEVHNHVRGLSPFPGAWLEAGPDERRERIKVLRTAVVAGSGTPGTVLDDHLTIACSEGAVRLMEVQRAGKRPMSADKLLRGFRLPTGSKVR